MNEELFELIRKLCMGRPDAVAPLTELLSTLTAPADPASAVLTGYEIGEAGAAADTDTISEAIGKLEARIAAVE